MTRRIPSRQWSLRECSHRCARGLGSILEFRCRVVFGTAVAKTIGKGLVHIEMVDQTVLLAGLLGAIGWNMITLILGLPTSSSHALMGGYGGAAVAKAGFVALIPAAGQSLSHSFFYRRSLEC